MSKDETGNVYIQQNLKTAQDLQSAGIEMEKSWSTCDDGKDCEICVQNQNAGCIPLNQAFPSGHQTPLAHDECRCDLLTQVVKNKTKSATKVQPLTKKRSNLLIIIGFIIGMCVLCIAVSFTMDALGLLPETTPIPSRTPAPANTVPPTITPAEKYFNEYGGSLDAYNEILALTDCALLQEKFNTASENNNRETPGTPLFKATTGYMVAADEHMRTLGCYNN